MVGSGILWIENLAVAFLFVATLSSCVARLRWVRTRAGLALGIVLLPLVFYVPVTAFLAWMRWDTRILAPSPIPMAALTVAYLVGAWWIRGRALRASAAEAGLPAGAAWSRGALALGWLAACFVHVLTLWSFDNESKIWLESLQAEAGGLALASTPPPVRDEDNGVLVYEEALARIERSRPWSESIEKAMQRLGSDDGDVDFSDPGLASFLDSQAAAISLLGKAAEFRVFRLEVAGVGSFGFRSRPRVTDFLAGARLVAADARRRAEQNRPDRAVAGVRTLFRMAEHAADMRQLVWVRVAVTVEALAARTLAAVLDAPCVGIEELEGLEIDASLSYTRAFDRAVTWEEAHVLAMVGHVAAPEGFFHLAMAPDDLATPSPSLGFVYRIFFMPDEIVRFRTWMARYHALAVRPYHEIAEDYRAFREELAGARLGFTGGIVMVAIAPLRGAIDRGDAYRRLARLAVAVRRHELAEGEPPASLDDLDLEAMPAPRLDPYSGESMRYVRDEDSWTLYSLGEDGDDDRGAPWDSRANQGDLPLRLGCR